MTTHARLRLPMAASRQSIRLQGVTGYGLVVGGAAYEQQNSGAAHCLSADTELDICRFEVRAGDTWAPSGSSSERDELQGIANFDFERDVWISTRMMIEPGPPNTGAWFVLTQIHRHPDAGDATASPPFALELDGAGTPIITTRGTTASTNTGNPPATVRWTHPAFVRGQWDHYIIRSRFSYANTGQLQVWLNGAEQINLSGLLNAYNDQIGPYAKFGAYRGPSPAGETTVVWHAGFMAGHESLAHLIGRPPHVPGIV